MMPTRQSLHVADERGVTCEDLYLFSRHPLDEHLALRTLTVFEDGSLAVDGAPHHVEQVFRDIGEGRLCASPADGSRVVVLSAAVLVVHVEDQRRFDQELRTVLADAFGRLRHGPTSRTRFRAALADAVRCQSAQSIESMRAAYEIVPRADRFALLDDFALQKEALEHLLYGDETERRSAFEILKSMPSTAFRVGARPEQTESFWGTCCIGVHSLRTRPPSRP